VNYRWHLITGEYPPQPGGVADYSQSVAWGLAAAGDEVIVWAPQCDGTVLNDGYVAVRRLPGHFGPKALAALDRGLRRRPGRVLLQYAPHAFGWKAMNVPLCAWLWARRRALDVMFHEVAYPFEAGQPWKHRMLAATNRGMAYLLLRSAERVFVSIPGWIPILRSLDPRDPGPVWVPIPSNLPTEYPAPAIAAVRQRWLRNGTRWLVGHFSTYAPTITRLLEPALVTMLAAAPDVHVLLLGFGGQRFADRVVRRYPKLAGRATATGTLDATSAGAHIAACDVVLQPYHDGISTRRTSAMAGVSLGRPIVTTEGHLSESLWRITDAVEIAAADELATAVLGLLADPRRREALGKRAEELYRSHFAVEHTIRALRQPLPAHEVPA